MEKEFITYEEALELKGLGFNEPCFGWFRSTLIPSNFTEYFLETEFGMNESPSDWVNSNFLDKACSAPLYQQSFRWFREKQNLKPDVTHATSNGGYTYTIWKWNFDNNVGKWERIGVINSWMTYEEAQFECLKKLIDIVKKQKEDESNIIV
jgi:hypothetical protein